LIHGCGPAQQVILEAMIEEVFFERHLILANEAVVVVIKGVIVAKLFMPLKTSKMKCS
jgi:hypothetical protein